jgi:hypothetical protein
MAAESSPVPSLEALRALARAQGVEPSDVDLVAATRFLATILPELREIEEAIPPGTAPAGVFAPEDELA